MIVNKETLQSLSVSIKTIFNNVFEKKATTHKQIATVIENISSMTVTYAWLGSFKKMREWVGDRVINNLTAHKYSLTKSDWELSEAVSRDDIEYDLLGLVKPRIEQMAHEAGTHYDEMLAELIESNAPCYDGKNMFATDHDIGSVAFSNIGTKKLTNMAALAARTEMLSLLSDEGKNLGLKPRLLLVPPHLEITAKKICNNTKINNVENDAQGMFDYLVLDHLTDTDAWYLLDVSRPVKPFILQINKPIKLEAMFSATDESVFMRKEFRYGVDSQDKAGNGLWQCAYKSTGVVA